MTIPPPSPPEFARLTPWLQDWLALEQSANDRVAHPRLKHRFALDPRHLARAYWPEQRPVFTLPYVLLPAQQTPSFGPAAEFVSAHFGLRTPRRQQVMFIHPGNAYIIQRLRRAGLRIHQSAICATPTSSFRSLLCWHPQRPQHAAIVKVALHLPISGVRRVLSEREVAGSVYIAQLLRAIDPTARQQLGLDFFHDEAGLYSRTHQLGHILRSLPPPGPLGSLLVPAFAFGSQHAGRLLLASLTSTPAEARLLVERLIETYVRTTSYLLFKEGIAHEFHPQNVLFELNGQNISRMILRDFYRAAVWPALRERLQRPSPHWPHLRRSRHTARYLLHSHWAPRAPTAYLRVFGVRGVVWELSRALRQSGKASAYATLKRQYLRCWQEACAVWLGIWPRPIRRGPSLALNAAIRQFLALRR